MKQFAVLVAFFSFALFTACAQKSPMKTMIGDLPPVITDPSKYNKLNADEARVLLHEGTERAFSGAYYDTKKEGVYICKQCNNPLFRSSDKFNSGTGWPSFDAFIDGNVIEKPDPDGSRTEIICANCKGHLGHVFTGEGFTKKNTRHCANSASLNFVEAKAMKPKDTKVQPISEYISGKDYEKYAVATFAGGCFWCTEASFERITGVVDVISGYAGGDEKYPTYEQIGAQQTGHTESIIIYFDPAVVSFETLLHVFFVAHDGTQLNRQGPDVGPQYRSSIFYQNEEQKAQAEAYVKEIDASKKYKSPIVTEIMPYKEFWVAEGYHQDYYEHHPENPYVQNVSRPKVEKVVKEFSEIVKKEYQR